MFPFFATSNAPNLSDPNNPEYGANGVNYKTIQNKTGDHVWTYYGCFLNVSSKINGQKVQTLLNGTHHCLVAEIAYDGAPIVNANGVAENPENCDKLAQRNPQVTKSNNPGSPETRIIPQTFDLRPSLPPILGQDILLQYPDELMIDWGNTPAGSKASIYWPQVSALQVLQLASRLYASHLLSASDANTIQCVVTKSTTYVPFAPGAGQNFAGLLTIELPPTVVKGQEFNVVDTAYHPIFDLRRRLHEDPSGGMKPSPRPRAQAKRKDSNQEINWRYVVGTFQVRIPVSTAHLILREEEYTLPIFKWRLQQMATTKRWYPVLQRYISYLAG